MCPRACERERETERETERQRDRRRHVCTCHSNTQQMNTLNIHWTMGNYRKTHTQTTYLGHLCHLCQSALVFSLYFYSTFHFPLLCCSCASLNLKKTTTKTPSKWFMTTYCTIPLSREKTNREKMARMNYQKTYRMSNLVWQSIASPIASWATCGHVALRASHVWVPIVNLSLVPSLSNVSSYLTTVLSNVTFSVKSRLKSRNPIMR